MFDVYLPLFQPFKLNVILFLRNLIFFIEKWDGKIKIHSKNLSNAPEGIVVSCQNSQARVIIRRPLVCQVNKPADNE